MKAVISGVRPICIIVEFRVLDSVVAGVAVMAAVSVTIASINAAPAVVRVVNAEVDVVPRSQATFWPGSITAKSGVS
jgi:O-acetylhomoserine/O-acetylserine sulfhydrylase-like pyridoxal-dependent enzyme